MKLLFKNIRDINSLIRNKAFHTEKADSSIVVSMKELYKYAYLLTFKKLFQPIDMWLYGNLSPLGAENLVEQNKKLFIKYLFITEKKALSRWDNQLKYKILKYYSLKSSDLKNISNIKEKAYSLIHSLSGLDKKEVCFFQKDLDFV